MYMHGPTTTHLYCFVSVRELEMQQDCLRFVSVLTI
jgi:hypothetical protein